jgi:hypothetical protein
LVFNQNNQAIEKNLQPNYGFANKIGKGEALIAYLADLMLHI